eukprot:Rhum_TRINITY_DN9521_c0_g2::Rhum_TRINITY_DN9521_c0_g2_i1::g.33911::m.33911
MSVVVVFGCCWGDFFFGAVLLRLSSLLLNEGGHEEPRVRRVYRGREADNVFAGIVRQAAVGESMRTKVEERLRCFRGHLKHNASRVLLQEPRHVALVLQRGYRAGAVHDAAADLAQLVRRRHQAPLVRRELRQLRHRHVVLQLRAQPEPGARRVQQHAVELRLAVRLRRLRRVELRTRDEGGVVGGGGHHTLQLFQSLRAAVQRHKLAGALHEIGEVRRLASGRRTHVDHPHARLRVEYQRRHHRRDVLQHAHLLQHAVHRRVVHQPLRHAHRNAARPLLHDVLPLHRRHAPRDVHQQLAAGVAEVPVNQGALQRRVLRADRHEDVDGQPNLVARRRGEDARREDVGAAQHRLPAHVVDHDALRVPLQRRRRGCLLRRDDDARRDRVVHLDVPARADRRLPQVLQHGGDVGGAVAVAGAQQAQRRHAGRTAQGGAERHDALLAEPLLELFLHVVLRKQPRAAGPDGVLHRGGRVVGGEEEGCLGPRRLHTSNGACALSQ